MNRSTLFHRLLFIAGLLVIVSAAEAQVTIGSGVEPLDGALLDLKQDGPDPENITSKKGMLYPRVKLTDKDNLFPMFEDDKNGGYKQKVKADEDRNHTGLVVYNITDDKTIIEGFLPGLHMWDGKTWRKIEDIPVIEPDIALLLCDAVTIIPNEYFKNESYNGILKVPYTGGNGGLYPSLGPTLIDNGLFIERIGGRLAVGGGEVTYHITGIPTVSSSTTTTTIPVDLFGETCNITLGSGDVRSIYVKNLSKDILVDKQFKFNSASTAIELSFEETKNGRVEITEAGTYVFSFRLYGQITRGDEHEKPEDRGKFNVINDRQTYYIYLSRGYGQSGRTVLDAAEIDLITPIISNPDFSYSVTLGGTFQAGDEVIIGMHSPVITTDEAKDGVVRQWKLWRDQCKNYGNISISACPIRTSMVYWKL
jgi:hypothetical protein